MDEDKVREIVRDELNKYVQETLESIEGLTESISAAQVLDLEPTEWQNLWSALLSILGLDEGNADAA